MSKVLKEHNTLKNNYFNQAKSLIDTNSLVSILSQLVDIPSPTGEEGELARKVVTLLNDYELSGEEQIIDAKQSNAHGKIKGSNAKDPSLMLYAPLDTVTSNNAAEDLPWAGSEMKPEMFAKSKFDNEFLYGLGAHNPKGHAACIIEAARVIKKANIPLKADLFLGFGAGGMPTNARKNTRNDSGHGVGCEYMMTHGPKPDNAVIAKSGWTISWEEVGLVWFEVSVEGIHNYSGARHLMPYKNPIVDASRLIERLDEWLKQWPEKHQSGLVAPQGVISFIESGWKRMPSFTPAVCKFRIDLRLSPRTTVAEAEKEFKKELIRLSDELDITTSYKTIVAIPGKTTNFNEPIIQESIKSWEAIEGKKHTPSYGMSGATDANILRAHGVPTARVGLKKAQLPNIDFQSGMNTVAIKDLYQLTVLLIHIAIQFCNIESK